MYGMPTTRRYTAAPTTASTSSSSSSLGHYPMNGHHQAQPHPFTAPMLQVSTSNASVHSEFDPNERTAMPGNAHNHTQFHSSIGHGPSSMAGNGLLGAPLGVVDVDVVETPTAVTGNALNRSLGTGGMASLGTSNSVISYTGHPPFFPSDQSSQQSSSAQLLPSQSSPQADSQQIESFTATEGLSRPLTTVEQERLAHLDKLKFFLATAPSRWDSGADIADPSNGPANHTIPEDFSNGVPAYSSSVYPPSSYPYQPPNGSTYASNPYPTSLIDSYGIGSSLASHALAAHSPSHPALNRFLLPNGEFVSCILWSGLYHITGTDIVRALVFRFEVGICTIITQNFAHLVSLGLWATCAKYEEV